MFDGIASAASGIAGSVLGFIGQQQTNQKSWDIAQASNQASAEQAQKQMDFQERMRKTQYQTAVDDLKAANLNPMLAYTNGGAGVPQGAQGSIQMPSFRSPVSSAKEAAMVAASTITDILLKEEQKMATTANAEVLRTQAISNIASAAKTTQDEKTSAAVEQVNREQLKAIAAEIQYKNQATRTSSAQAALTSAQTKNEAEITAKTANPWWVNKLTEFGKELHNKWQFIRQKQGN